MHWKYPAPTPASFISNLRYWERFLYLAESIYKTFSIFPRNPEFFGGDEQNAGDLVMGMPKRGDAQNAVTPEAKLRWAPWARFLERRLSLTQD